MGESENIEIVKKGYDAFLRGDVDTLLAMFTDDIEWQLDRNEKVPFTGVRHGKEEVGDFFRMVNEFQQPLEFETREYIAQGDKVVALGHSAWSVKPTHQTYETDFAEVFTIRDGKVARFREYADTHAASEAYKAM